MSKDPLFRLKIIGGILLSFFVLTLARTVTLKIYSTENSEPPAYSITDAMPKKNAQKQQEQPIGDLSVLLKDGNIEDGKRIATKCRACHSLKKSGNIKIGPPLWGIVDSPAGAFFGFSYSQNLKKKNIHWSPQNIDLFIKDPQDYIPGTKMRFNGIDGPIDRANLISYLQTLNSLSNGTR